MAIDNENMEMLELLLENKVTGSIAVISSHSLWIH